MRMDDGVVGANEVRGSRYGCLFIIASSIGLWVLILLVIKRLLL